MRADLTRERLLDVGVGVEVEAALLDEAGRDALGRPRVTGTDGPPVRDEGHEQHEAEQDGRDR